MSLNPAADYDVFMSYNWGSKPYVRKLYDYLTNIQSFKVWIDDKELTNDLLFDQLGKGIKSSKCFVCCITKKYCDSDNCQKELNYASVLKKPLIVLMLERLDIGEINAGIGIIITQANRFDIYDEMNSTQTLDKNGIILNTAVSSISDLVYRSKHVQNNSPLLETIDKSKATKSNELSVVFSDEGIYEGEVVDGKFHGKGKFMYLSGKHYEGDWENGFQNGFGVEESLDNDRFEGVFKDGKKNGDGIYFFANGDIQHGTWANNQLNGLIRYFFVNGDHSECYYAFDKRIGKEILFRKNGMVSKPGPISYNTNRRHN